MLNRIYSVSCKESLTIHRLIPFTGVLLEYVFIFTGEKSGLKVSVIFSDETIFHGTQEIFCLSDDCDEIHDGFVELTLPLDMQRSVSILNSGCRLLR